MGLKIKKKANNYSLFFCFFPHNIKTKIIYNQLFYLPLQEIYKSTMSERTPKKPFGRKPEGSRTTRNTKSTSTFGRKPRRDDDSERKPRARKELGDTDRKPRFKREDDDRRTSRFSSRDNNTERKPRVKREFGDTDRKPRFKRDDDQRRTSRFSSNSFDKKPRTRKPIDDNFEKPKRKTTTNTSGETRLNKFIANSGICSRRDADNYITAGVVSVNGKVITEMGYKVQAGDDVRFNGERMKGETKVYLVMNKPKNFVTTTGDPHADKTVMDLIGEKCTQRVFPVGRLDKNTTGVLLFTNDGELTEQLTHPSFNKKKIYEVHLNRKVKVADLRKLIEGVELEDGMAIADHVEYVNIDKKEVGLEIHSGRNRVVRRMFEALGYTVEALDRVYFAGLTKKNIKRGQWRFLTESEINMLRMGAYE